ncbi:methionyl-tRNA formyltransferase [Roseivirga thermotolerans]|uniref:methionyl-tRNA formyltransferase n=1 Tax=Roseivirga thermotolerans TaxID=1758176 RepID=UPI0027402B7F|nr:formyltransferase family protein [Roseivirga thermotolerans]
MKIGLIGRTSLLLETGKQLNAVGFEIAFIITSKEAPEYSVTSNDFKKFASDVGCPFLHDPAISREKVLDLMQGAEVPLVISINYSGVISKDVTELFPLGILNAHGGDLPRYRGNACQAWAILNGEKRIGLCIHRMVGGELDSGAILARKYYPIDINTRIGEVYEWFEKDIPSLFLEVAEKLKSNPTYILETQSKESSDVMRCYPRIPEDGRIDWSQSAEQILRLINASSEPYSGAFTFDQKGRKVTIWRALLFEDNENYSAVPGQVAQILEEGVVVITGFRKILLKKIEVDGIRSSPGNYFKSIRQRFN